jgi:hypothetical protein
MIAEAKALEVQAAAEILEIRWGAATLDGFFGETGKAMESLERALALSRATEDRWIEYECLRQLVQLDLEMGRRTGRCAELVMVASKMGEGSELPVVGRSKPRAAPETGGAEALERALEGLRRDAGNVRMRARRGCRTRRHLVSNWATTSDGTRDGDGGQPPSQNGPRARRTRAPRSAAAILPNRQASSGARFVGPQSTAGPQRPRERAATALATALGTSTTSVLSDQSNRQGPKAPEPQEILF